MIYYLIKSNISLSSNESLKFSSSSSAVIILLPTHCKLMFGFILSGNLASPLTPFGVASILAADGIIFLIPFYMIKFGISVITKCQLSTYSHKRAENVVYIYRNISTAALPVLLLYFPLLLL